MAQAAKHLRKNKDLEALAEQERKEKEEETLKKRSRSRDKKRKVLVLFTGGVARVGWWGVRWGGSGGWRRRREGGEAPPPSFSVREAVVKGAGAHMETQSRACFYCVDTRTHMYVLHIQSQGNVTTHCMLFHSSRLLDICLIDCAV